jgi:polyhydroxyalkanoate synthesis regulator protein
LTDLVRHYQDQAQSMTPAFLSQVFEAFKEQQEKVMNEFGSMQGKVFDPNSVLSAMQAWQEKQAEFFSHSMKGWGMGREASPQEKPSANAAENTDDANSNKIAEMEAHLKALQEQLGKMK